MCHLLPDTYHFSRRQRSSNAHMLMVFRLLGFCQKGTGMAKQEPIRQLSSRKISAQPRLRQKTSEIQPYGTVLHLLPLDLEEPVRLEVTEQLNQLLADTMTLRDLYKKSHWQAAGPTFYQLHLLF